MLAKRFEQDLPMFELLSKSNDEILAAIRGESAVSASSPTGNEAAREALARTCSQIESLKADRNSLTDQMNAMKLSEDFCKCFQLPPSYLPATVFDAFFISDYLLCLWFFMGNFDPLRWVAV
ncbi:hypothetical protein T265_12211 [Opisthorchis viverrini]|uniref:ALIX V-shaped domain-containing protein n=1 Tax=Opisthorchis viverrini TaxID=6198 RepID=A0A074YZJ2_OPIVI|nr:hypothetical protein T265_12211 [Opisthorchis viverrini]KER18627.1 hypothetical protein T265_12211 [Opisthorchis viverrini]